MNVATYRCFNCSYDTQRSFEDRPSPTIPCEKCGETIKWKSVIYGLKPVRKFADCSVDSQHQHFRWSDAMGINPDQIPQLKEYMQKNHPNIDLIVDEPTGKIGVNGRNHKKQLMKAFHMSELDGSTWRNSQAQVKVKRSR